jgi:glycine betaine catabolism A
MKARQASGQSREEATTSFMPQAATLRLGSAPLAAPYYTSAAVFAEEVERIFGDSWLCVARSAELPAAGDFVTVHVADESVLLVRSDTGVLGYFNTCRHRGSILCDTPEGSVGSMIRCPYHGWAYQLDGSLAAAPLMEGVVGFDKTAFGLTGIAAAEWEGFIFVNLSPVPEPFGATYHLLLERFRCWGIDRLTEMRRADYSVSANWKLIAENYSECYHCPTIHPAFARRCDYRSGHNDFFEGMFLGGYMELNAPYPSLTASGRACAPVLPGVTGADTRRVYFYALLPNLLLSLHPDYVTYYTLWPEAPDITRVRCGWLFNRDATTEAAADDAFAFWDNANREDFVALERNQRGISSRSYSPAPYSAQESLAAAVDDYVLARLSPDTAR